MIRTFLAIKHDTLQGNVQKLQVELENCGLLIAQIEDDCDNDILKRQKCVEKQTNFSRSLDDGIAALTEELHKVVSRYDFQTNIVFIEIKIELNFQMGVPESQNNSEPILKIPAENEHPNEELDDTKNEPIDRMVIFQLMVFLQLRSK